MIKLMVVSPAEKSSIMVHGSLAERSLHPVDGDSALTSIPVKSILLACFPYSWISTPSNSFIRCEIPVLPKTRKPDGIPFLNLIKLLDRCPQSAMPASG